MEALGRKTVEEFHEAEKIPVVIILDNIRSMHNVGSIFRTADAFLIEAIYLCGFTPRPPHRDIQKTALGATETVRWQYIEGAEQAVLQLSASGYTLVAVEQTEQSIQPGQLKSLNIAKLALIFGNEVDGVDGGLLKYCQGVIEIPQEGTKHSLNVSVAAGIVIWEAYNFFKSKNTAGRPENYEDD